MTIILWLIALTGTAILSFLFGLLAGLVSGAVLTSGTFAQTMTKNGYKLVGDKVYKIGE